MFSEYDSAWYCNDNVIKMIAVSYCTLDTVLRIIVVNGILKTVQGGRKALAVHHI